MPYSFNGIGTSYHGQCDFKNDGSYVTTEWFIVAYVPVIPMKSMRVRDVNTGLFGSSCYTVMGETPRHWIQIAKTWAYVAFILALFIAVLASKVDAIVQTVLIGAALLLPFGLRWFAMRKAYRSFR